VTSAFAVDKKDRALAAAFCGRHGIRSIVLTPMEGVTASHRVCNLEFEFAEDEQHSAYRANFKLQGAAAAIGDVIAAIDDSGAVKFVADTPDAREYQPILESFFKRIERRLGKVRQEQSVQSITFLGNSFLLHGTTTFTVIADDDGRLGIEIHKGNERQPANLLASSLLDGLYDGSIELLQPGTSSR
jgi:hypothetical protein